MICDWLDNREYLFREESSIKVDVFRVRWEKRSDVHTKDKKIRREISSRTKTSLAKVSFSEKLSKIERPHQPDPNLTVSQSHSLSSGRVDTAKWMHYMDAN